MKLERNTIKLQNGDLLYIGTPDYIRSVGYDLSDKEIMVYNNVCEPHGLILEKKSGNSKSAEFLSKETVMKILLDNFCNEYRYNYIVTEEDYYGEKVICKNTFKHDTLNEEDED